MVIHAQPEPDVRVYFAAQRTMLAWLRTGVALMGFGFVVARFGLFVRELALVRGVALPGAGFSAWAGTALLAVGVVVNVLAAARFSAFAREFRRGGAARLPRIAPDLAVTILVAAIGVVLTIYLIATG